ncbi:MAG: hypothetical protein ACJA1W_000190 [Akkermansiaceae bacterium]|jgi:hypothetical protein
MKIHTLSSLLLLGIALPSQAVIIASTSFEEVTGYDSDYRDADLTAHTLANMATAESVADADDGSFGSVQSSATANEIGFFSTFTPTDFTGDNGLSDGDEIGVSTQADDNGGFTDGVQGFKMEDIDGLLTTTFDTVDLTGFASSYLSLDIWVNSTGWEDDNGDTGTTGLVGDSLKISLIFNDASELALFDSAGADMDDLFDEPGNPVEGEWTTLVGDLSGFTSATLSIEFASNSGAEEIYLDNIVFTDVNPIPEPSSALFGLLGAGFLLRRRR